MLRFLKLSCLTLTLALFNAGCESFLETDTVGKASIPVFFSDVDGIRAALPGAYSKVYEYYDSEFYLYPQVAGDLLNLSAIGEDVQLISQYNFDSEPDQEASAVGHIWQKGYDALANVNNILEYQPALLDEFPSSEAVLLGIRAESLFLRALIHFDLVRTYAQTYTETEQGSHIGIPVLTITPSESDNPPRNTVNETYQQIIIDLKEAITLFEQYPNEEMAPFRASKVTSQSLLAKVYLYMENWEQAKSYAESVLDIVPLAKRENYIDMFRTLNRNQELIFVLNGELKKSKVGKFYAASGPVATAADKLMESFIDTNDIRLQLIDESFGKFNTLKYSRPDVNEVQFGSDLFVLRSSELMLINAEANAQLGLLDSAKENIKKIQSRALGIPVEEIQLDEQTKEDVLSLIETETLKELCFEGQRLFDLKRWHKDLIRDESTSSNVKQLANPSYLFALPIPLKEINVNNNIIQNEGY